MKKRYKILLGILGSILIFWTGGWTQEKFNLGAALFNQHHLEEGLKRYAPTRMEWLALQLERRNSFTSDTKARTGFYVSYTDAGNRLAVFLRYRHNAEYEKIKKVPNMIWREVNQEASHYGWDQWVKVRLELHKSPNPKQDIDWWFKELDPTRSLTAVYEWKGNEKPKLIKSD